MTRFMIWLLCSALWSIVWYAHLKILGVSLDGITFLRVLASTFVLVFGTGAVEKLANQMEKDLSNDQRK